MDHGHLGADGDKECVRSALCTRRNTDLGMFGDTFDSLMKLKDAIFAYLKSPPGHTHKANFKGSVLPVKTIIIIININQNEKTEYT